MEPKSCGSFEPFRKQDPIASSHLLGSEVGYALYPQEEEVEIPADAFTGMLSFYFFSLLSEFILLWNFLSVWVSITFGLILFYCLGYFIKDYAFLYAINQ